MVHSNLQKVYKALKITDSCYTNMYWWLVLEYTFIKEWKCYQWGIEELEYFSLSPRNNTPNTKLSLRSYNEKEKSVNCTGKLLDPDERNSRFLMLQAKCSQWSVENGLITSKRYSSFFKEKSLHL